MFKREALYNVNNIFINRWSPRAMSGQPISKEQLMTLFEAARWAPSSYNGQPWRFVYAMRDTKQWNKLFNLMVPFNQEWTKNAAVLVLIISKKTFDYNNKPARTHSFDAGSAWMSLALQGSLMGLVVHGMEGFDYDKARTEYNIPADYDIEAMFAIGMPGRIEDLSPELAKREEISDRKQQSDFAFEGEFKIPAGK
jgi:nitroreductase